MNLAEEAHRKAWENLAESAKEDRYAKYGIYAARSLVVKHPEIYLIGDDLFYQGARKIKGFKECYEEPTALGWRHMEYGGEFRKGKPAGYEGIPDGHPLSFSEIKLDKYRLTDAHRIYPEPFFSILDQRLAPLAVSLKVEGKAVTPLELAEMYYFQAKEEGANPEHLFLVYCDNQEAYILNGQELFSVRENAPVTRSSGNPILIFNEQSVWYPMMERDDRQENDALRNAVDNISSENTVPSVEEWEKTMINHLKMVSALDSEVQLRLAAIAATRATAWGFHPFATAWKSIVPDEDFSEGTYRRFGVIREFDRQANSVSPATAYLHGVVGTSGSLEQRMRFLSSVYLRHTGVVREKEAFGWKEAWRLESWGHLWPCCLMEHTIDDAFRSRTGHCVSQAHMIGSVLEMMRIPHVVVHFDRGKIETAAGSHHFILSQDGAFLFDDGIVNFQGIDSPTEEYGPLLSFSINGGWAFTVGDKLYGNIPSTRVVELVNKIEKALNDRFELTFFADQRKKEIVSKSHFLTILEKNGIEQVSLP